MNRFWPVREAAQADYESLREQVLQGIRPNSLMAARFDRFGLAGLITRPFAEPVWLVSLRGATRPRWSPHVDPRLEALADGYRYLFASLAAPGHQHLESQG